MSSVSIKEALWFFKEELKQGKCSEDCLQCNSMEIAISALEKQIPKKPIITDWVYCPNCNWKIAMLIGKEVCPKCGQVLDWSDVK